MRRTPAALVFLALLASGALAGDARSFAEAARVSAPPSPLPQATVVDAAGAAAALATLTDGATLLAIWAEWCPVCREELPKLAAAARGMEGVRLLLLSVDTRPGAAERTRAFLDRLGLPDHPALFDDGHAAAAALGVEGVPTVAMIDSQGKVRATVTGRMDWRDPAFAAYVSALRAGGN